MGSEELVVAPSYGKCFLWCKPSANASPAHCGRGQRERTSGLFTDCSREGSRLFVGTSVLLRCHGQCSWERAGLGLTLELHRRVDADKVRA